MKEVSPAFRKLDNRDIVPIVYQRVNCNMIFDVKMEYFHSKARLVAGVHVTEPLETIPYEKIVSRDTVRIDLELSVLNDFPVKAVVIKKCLHHSYCNREDMDSPGP